MFERYTENARRCLFFARFEASRCGTNTIEPQHLLVGLLKDASAEISRFIATDVAARMLADLTGSPEVSIATSLQQDVPLSQDSKHVLACAAETAQELRDPHIGTEHLLLALMRYDTPARVRLGDHGIALETAGTNLGAWVPPGRFGSVSPFSTERMPTLRHRVVDRDPRPGITIFETHRRFEGHEIRVVERMIPSDDGKSVNYSVEISGPKQATGRVEITFELE